MAKINKQNPLKTFNDNYAARAKKVVEGNNKLVKAQIGIAALPPSLENFRKGKTYQGPLDESANKMLNEMYPSTSAPGVMPNENASKGLYGYGEMGSGTAEMFKRNLKENTLRSESEKASDLYKKGGQTKTKKK